MIELYDFKAFPESNRDYGGNSGLKLGILMDGEPWMLKFPKSTLGYRNRDMSYTTSPLSEYVGSKVYESLGIEVHETRLGVYGRKVVVACKDIVPEGAHLLEFSELKNRYSAELDEYLSTSGMSESSGAYGMTLETVEAMFRFNPALRRIAGLEDHFWDMFIVDSLIGNNDRNNGNWGVINDKGQVRISPVYDNGNAFRNKASDRQLERTLGSEDALKDSAYRIQACFFEEEDGKKLNPHTYILSGKNPKCNEAVQRLIPRIDLEKIRRLIEEIPTEWNGYPVMSETRKAYCYKVMELRYRDILAPTFRKLRDPMGMNLQENKKKDKVR